MKSSRPSTGKTRNTSGHFARQIKPPIIPFQPPVPIVPRMLQSVEFTGSSEAAVLKLLELYEALCELEQRLVKYQELHYPDTFAEKYIDNDDLLILANIDKPTAQKWRKKKKIPYSHIGNKFYYNRKTITQMLEDGSLSK